jgi:hypothetical protein
VTVSERTICGLVVDGIVGNTPPWRGNPGSIPPLAYKALKDAVTTFITIHQASGKYENKRSKISRIVNYVINSNPEENRRNDQLMAHLQKDFGSEKF